MSGTRLDPEKITHPFQLMAAWFAMLILLDGILLETAVRIDRPSWAAGFLLISADGLAVAVLLAVFLMLTRYRPHLQDSKDYATWLREERKFKATFTSSSSSALAIREVTTKSTGLAGEVDVLDVESSSESVTISKESALIQITDAKDADKLVSALRKANFEASIYRSEFHEGPNPLFEHASIWIGYRVPAEVTVPVIEIAKSVWPHLKYLHLSSDDLQEAPDWVHDEIYIGGATSTALEYGIKRWTKSDFEGLNSIADTQQMHKAIRGKYSNRGNGS